MYVHLGTRAPPPSDFCSTPNIHPNNTEGRLTAVQCSKCSYADYIPPDIHIHALYCFLLYVSFATSFLFCVWYFPPPAAIGAPFFLCLSFSSPHSFPFPVQWLFVKNNNVKRGFRFAGLDMAAEQGHAGAAFIAGGIYYQGGGGVAQDFKKALEHFVLAADEGNDCRAMGNIGSMYAAGHGVPNADNATAMVWYRRAADRGDQGSLEMLASLVGTVPVGTAVTIVGLTGASVQHLNGKRGVIVPPKRGLGPGRVLVKVEVEVEVEVESSSSSSSSGRGGSGGSGGLGSKPKAIKVENLAIYE